MRDDPLVLTNAEVMSEHGPILCCRIGADTLEIARRHVRAGSEVAHAGDRGKLIIPLWIGIISGVMASQSQHSRVRM
jgi:hypothetical protein